MLAHGLAFTQQGETKMKEVVEKFIEQYFIDNGIPLIGKRPQQIDYVKMSVYGYREMCSSSTIKSFTKKWFPNKPPRVHLPTYILYLQNKKYCPECDNILDIEEFSPNKRKSNGLNGPCKTCSNARSLKWQKENPGLINANNAKYRAYKLQRTAAWANLELIKQIYLECPEGYHVDHIIALLAELISGLHIETNLQYLTARDNLRKGNKYPFNDYLDKPIIPPCMLNRIT